jgi:hypothetical protein
MLINLVHGSNDYAQVLETNFIENAILTMPCGSFYLTHTHTHIYIYICRLKILRGEDYKC